MRRPGDKVAKALTTLLLARISHSAPVKVTTAMFILFVLFPCVPTIKSPQSNSSLDSITRLYGTLAIKLGISLHRSVQTAINLHQPR